MSNFQSAVRRLLILGSMLSVTLASTAMAQEVRYTWVEMSYVEQNAEIEGTRPTPIPGQTVVVNGVDGDGIRFRASGAIRFSHSGLGTTPNMAPPSRCWLPPSRRWHRSAPTVNEETRVMVGSFRTSLAPLVFKPPRLWPGEAGTASAAPAAPAY